MNRHRKLLVLAINEALKLHPNLLDPNYETGGFLFAEVAGEPSVINWRDAGYQELRISVWWKYDHSRHPQANAEGDFREEFRTAGPLAKRQHFSKFVGATASGWIERKTAKHLQGEGKEKLFSIYTRQGEERILDALADPVPNGFKAEGPFFL